MIHKGFGLTETAKLVVSWFTVNWNQVGLA
jgi:hypothetical protein